MTSPPGGVIALPGKQTSPRTRAHPLYRAKRTPAQPAHTTPSAAEMWTRDVKRLPRTRGCTGRSLTLACCSCGTRIRCAYMQLTWVFRARCRSARARDSASLGTELNPRCTPTI